MDQAQKTRKNGRAKKATEADQHMADTLIAEVQEMVAELEAMHQFWTRYKHGIPVDLETKSDEPPSFTVVDGRLVAQDAIELDMDEAKARIGELMARLQSTDIEARPGMPEPETVRSNMQTLKGGLRERLEKMSAAAEAAVKDPELLHKVKEEIAQLDGKLDDLGRILATRPMVRRGVPTDSRTGLPYRIFHGDEWPSLPLVAAERAQEDRGGVYWRVWAFLSSVLPTPQDGVWGRYSAAATAEKIGASRPAVQSAYQKLKRDGLLESDGAAKAARYQVVPIWHVDMP